MAVGYFVDAVAALDSLKAMFRPLAIFLLCAALVSRAEIVSVWLTHSSETPSDVVLNWTTSKPVPSEVFFRSSDVAETRAGDSREKNLHSVKIPVSPVGREIFYKICDSSGGEFSSKINAYPVEGEFRAVFIGNLGYAKNVDFSAIAADRPHIIFTCGDNIPALHSGGVWGGSLKPFEGAIKKFPVSLLASTPIMPVLGNHDREIRPRGTKYPKEPVYDVSASAYGEFFKLPQPFKFWKFSVPEFNATFAALDLCHTGDFGTTWQACSPFSSDSAQYARFAEIAGGAREKLLFAIMNERSQNMRDFSGGIWRRLFSKATVVVSGFGYYLERAHDEVPYYNTSLCAGDKYPDRNSKFFSAESGYLLVSIRKGGGVRCRLKSVKGVVLDDCEAAGSGK